MQFWKIPLSLLSPVFPRNSEFSIYYSITLLKLVPELVGYHICYSEAFAYITVNAFLFELLYIEAADRLLSYS